jgi:hypothetical protein
MKIPRVRFIAGFVLGSLVFGTAAYSVNVSNTPESGYLLCYNTKTKAVTFPGKLACPRGTKGIELGAQGLPGVDGIDGSDGYNGLPGPQGVKGDTGATGPQGVKGDTGATGPQGVKGDTGATGPQGARGIQGLDGRDGNGLPGYLVYLKQQDVIASVASKSKRVMISKSGFKSGYYTLTSEVQMLFQNTIMQSVLCLVETTGNSRTYSAFPSHELANSWTGHTVQLTGLLYVSSPQDLISISCSFSGNAQVSYGYLLLIPTAAPEFSNSN